MTDSIRELPPLEVQAYLEQHPEAQRVDVREPWEYEMGRMQGAVSIPLGTLQQRFDEIDPNKPAVLICAGGVRSAEACKFLASKGYKQLINVAQGTKGWIRQDLPTEKG